MKFLLYYFFHAKFHPTSVTTLSDETLSLLCVEDYHVIGGSRRWGTSCTYDFFSTADVTSGRFFSEKFPQNYPPSMSCSYLLAAAARQVITLTFSSVRLANGRRHHHHHHHQQQQLQQQDHADSRSVWGQLHHTSYWCFLLLTNGHSTFHTFDAFKK